MYPSILKRLAGVGLAAAIAASVHAGGFPLHRTVSAAGTNYHFDFGGGGTASGYTGVSAADGYNASRGYGFAKTSGVKNVSASGGGALSDAVQFTDTAWSNTFNVDLPNGLYRVKVTLGNTTRTSVVAEDVLQIINMTGNNATDTILIPITDGQLNIMACPGKAGYAYTMSALDIEWVSDATQLPPTIWFCGDSTVCNYYPKETSAQAGWGQVFDQFIGDGWQVRNMAASGQYAAGFVNAGQFAPILKYGKEGDVYIISIGINDTNYSNRDEYTQVVTSMVQQAKAKGIQVILVKQQGRKGDYTRNPLLTGRWFGGELDAIGKAEGVQVLDLFNLFQDYCVSIGAAAADALFIDNLHPNRAGALKLAELAATQIKLGDAPVSSVTGAEIDESMTFMLKNGNSGLYLTLAGDPADGTNVVQAENAGIDAGRSLWRAEAAGDGYYRLVSCADESKLLDVENMSAESGANIGIWSDTACDAQLFKFLEQENGSYVIATKTTNCASALEIVNALTDSGANAQQWERNGHACQTWFLEAAVQSAADVTLGDLNADGVINGFDAAILKKMLKDQGGSRQQRRSGDVNADAAVDAADCKQLVDFLLHRQGLEAVEQGNRVYYAVDQAYRGGVEENTNAGFAYDAYLNLHNQAGTFTEWTVTVPKDGNYLCTFHIANGSANDRQMKVEVNNAKDYWMQPFLTTSAWTTWQERGIVLPLQAGKNLIRTTSATAEGGPNLDYLRLEWTDEPIAEIYVPEEKPPVTDDGGDVTIYIAGDSTVQSYKASYAPQQGWGYYLGNYFTANTSVANHAIAGRSSKSFYDNGRLDTILNQIQAGDYLLVQFGINDGAYNKAERYAPTCGQVPGTDGSFEFYMAKYIEGALNKGATPILISPTLGLKSYKNGTFVSSYTNYTDSVKKLSAYYKVPYIDLNGLMVDHYNKIGYDAAYKYHLCGAVAGSTDMTHFSETGANAVAGLVANAIKGLGVDISGRVNG